MHNFFLTFTLMLFLVLVLAGSVVLSYWLFKKALYVVVDRFREFGALEEKKARPLAELGLKHRDFWDNFRFQLRDYKPYALQMLLAYDIVCITPEGKYYLSEEKLAYRIPAFQEQYN